jgi:Domain of unknown function (DUF4252)
MKKIVILLLALPLTVTAQTKTTIELDKKYEGMSLYFYKSTLKMLNQNDDKNFDELVKDIEKMRFMSIDKGKEKFGKLEYGALKKSYQGESYDEVMTGRFDGRNLDVFVKEVNGNVKGTVVLVNDSTNVYVLDILGKVALDKVSSLFNGNTNISKKITDFMKKDNTDEQKEKDKDVKNK